MIPDRNAFLKYPAFLYGPNVAWPLGGDIASQYLSGIYLPPAPWSVSAAPPLNPTWKFDAQHGCFLRARRRKSR